MYENGEPVYTYRPKAGSVREADGKYPNFVFLKFYTSFYNFQIHRIRVVDGTRGYVRDGSRRRPKNSFRKWQSHD